MPFVTLLKNAGWVELQELARYRKGTWELTFDTGNWIEVGTSNNPRVFDVPVPEPHHEQWCLNLIEHLCSTNNRVFALECGKHPGKP